MRELDHSFINKDTKKMDNFRISKRLPNLSCLESKDPLNIEAAIAVKQQKQVEFDFDKSAPRQEDVHQELEDSWQPNFPMGPHYEAPSVETPDLQTMTGSLSYLLNGAPLADAQKRAALAWRQSTVPIGRTEERMSIEEIDLTGNDNLETYNYTEARDNLPCVEGNRPLKRCANGSNEDDDLFIIWEKRKRSEIIRMEHSYAQNHDPGPLADHTIEDYLAILQDSDALPFKETEGKLLARANLKEEKQQIIDTTKKKSASWLTVVTALLKARSTRMVTGSILPCQVTYFRNETDFVVVPVENLQSYQEQIGMLENYAARNGRRPHKKPALGRIVMAKVQGSNDWHSAIMLSQEQDQLFIVNQMQVVAYQGTDVKTAPKYEAEMPWLPMWCQLADGNPTRRGRIKQGDNVNLLFEERKDFEGKYPVTLVRLTPED